MRNKKYSMPTTGYITVELWDKDKQDWFDCEVPFRVTNWGSPPNYSPDNPCPGSHLEFEIEETLVDGKDFDIEPWLEPSELTWEKIEADIEAEIDTFEPDYDE